MKNINKLIAKSNDLKLKVHSQIVRKTALLFLNKMYSDEPSRFENIIKYSSLLHDIGKGTTNFQKYLLGKIKKPNLRFRHNEIGWAFLSKYLSNDFEGREIIINIVYWHHGISNQLNKHTDTEILNSLDEISIENMLQYLIECVGENNVNGDVEFADSTIAPLFYPPNEGNFENKRPQLQLCRSIVITADRISSNLMSISDVNEGIVNQYFNLKNETKITETKFDGTPRLNKQKEIVELAENTTIIKAPAGFGKTIMGVMWSFKYKKKVVWVTPRNTIAESLYLSVLDEFKNLNINPTVANFIEKL